MKLKVILSLALLAMVGLAGCEQPKPSVPTNTGAAPPAAAPPSQMKPPEAMSP